MIEKELGVDMSTLMHINDYMIDCYGHSIEDKSATNRVRSAARECSPK